MVTGGLQDEEEHKTRKAGVAGLAAGGDRRGGAGRAALHAVAHGESGAAVKGVTVVSAMVSDDPVMATALDSESCQKLADCLRGIRGRWSGFTGKTFIQYHGVSYEIYVRYAEDGQLMHCRLFDGKLYCESFRFTLTDSDAARLTQCITELMASHAE